MIIVQQATSAYWRPGLHSSINFVGKRHLIGAACQACCEFGATCQEQVLKGRRVWSTYRHISSRQPIVQCGFHIRLFYSDYYDIFQMLCKRIQIMYDVEGMYILIDSIFVESHIRAVLANDNVKYAI